MILARRLTAAALLLGALLVLMHYHGGPSHLAALLPMHYFG